MNMRLPPLSWLRAFEASARHLSFTHAAQELNLTQAAISKQIKLLEHYLREPLFQRQPRSLVLTKVGAAYLPKVRDAFERLAAGTEEVFGSRRTEMLTLRAPVSFSVNWIVPRLPRFLECHPKIRLRIVSSVWNEGLEKERFDLDIRYGKGKWPGFRSDRLSWEFLQPVCAPELVEGPAGLHQPGDLAAHTLLHVLGYEEGWAIWLRAVGLGSVNPGRGLQFDTSLQAFEMAAGGAGIALGRSSLLEKELARGRLVLPFADRVPIDEAFHLISPDDGLDHPDAATLRAWLLQEATAAKDPTHPKA
jgi:LysR family transcriptional regulator, glycine cleavage system transcriptional activator